MNYHIYIADAVGSDPARHFARVGLADLIDSAPPSCTEVRPPEGPDDGGGMLFTWQAAGAPLINAIDRTTQTWLPTVAREGFAAGVAWIGWQTASPPTPHDLLRPNPLSGPTIGLSGDRLWRVPVAKLLPRKFGQTPDGQPDMLLDERHVQLWEDASRYHDHILNWRETAAYGDLLAYPALGDEFQAALRVLGHNYRINETIARAFALFDHFDPLAILAASFEHDVSISFEIDNWIVAQKKTAVIPAGPASASSSPVASA